MTSIEAFALQSELDQLSKTIISLNNRREQILEDLELKSLNINIIVRGGSREKIY